MALYQIDLCKISLHFEGEKVNPSILQVIYIKVEMTSTII